MKRVLQNSISWQSCKVIIFFLLLLVSITGFGQNFGRNKVNYHQFDFKILQTPHFDIYNYLQDTSERNRFGQQAEQWYKMHQQLLKDTFNYRNPLIIYNNHAHFQQTRVISGLISVGTGGVTEGLKNRVVMPFMESNVQTDHVLGHELVHAFQYSLVRNSDSLSFNNALSNLPLWMVEGLAEYMSIGYKDAHTAIWLRSAVKNDKLPTLKKLTTRPDEFFPYRWGQAFWAFVTGRFGDTTIRPLFMETARVGYEKAIENILYVTPEALEQEWQKSLRYSYQPYKANTDSLPAGTNLINKDNAGEINIVPSISPDGQWMAFWTEKDVFSLDLYIADATTGKNLKKVTSNRYSSHIDNYSSYESTVAWSPDSKQVAYTVFSEGRNQLVIASTAGRNRKTVEIPGVQGFSNPTWSPDGRTIVVTGLVNGNSDLYAYDIHTEQVSALTQDPYSEIHPSFSPDGKWIVFATDRRSLGNTLTRHNLSFDIAVMEVATKNVTLLTLFNGANNLNPVFGENNNSIYFLSDRDGFRNLYSYNRSNNTIVQHTKLFTGITGITLYAPAISYSRATNTVVYSYYDNDTYRIYSAKAGELKQINVSANDISNRAALLPPFNRIGGENIVVNNIEQTPQPVPDTSLVVKDYKARFQLDYISNNASVGVSTNRFGTGLAGGVNALFTDMLGHHQLFSALSLNGRLVDVAGQVTYYNQKKRLNWGVGYSHIPYYSGAQGTFYDSIEINGEKDRVINQSVEILRTFEDQVSALVAYPFSQTRRVELGGSFSWYYYKLERYNRYYDDSTGYYLGFEHEKDLPTPDGFNFGNLYLAYVSDNSYFGITSPLKGHRMRLEAGQYLGVVNIHTLMGDYRRYIRLAPFTIATRNMFYGRFGKDASGGALSPLYLGYPWWVRGYESNRFTREGKSQELNINELVGNKIFVSNVELRFPFTGPEQLSAIPSRLIFTELSLFTDGGIAWGDAGNQPGTIQAKANTDAQFVVSSGLSLRVNLFGYLVIEPYYAIPWQNGGFSNGSFGLNFFPGW